MNIKLTLPDAKAPTRSNPTDAGADLYSTVDAIILPMSSLFIDFGVQFEIPVGFAGFIFARSGLGSKGITPKNCVGVIDSKYRGNAGIMLENNNREHTIIHKGDRIAQIVIMPIDCVEFTVVNELDMTNDRNGGFGASGR